VSGARKLRQQEEFLRRLHGVPEQTEPDEPVQPDFDGGARESAPEPADPEGAHRELLLTMFQKQHGRL
jgi:hypothetical protein